ncbi:MAG: bifunctional glutamine synthetase adenylyltransferase/deadenyltransferase, partial [Gammaproteobacteria bacterium]
MSQPPGTPTLPPEAGRLPEGLREPLEHAWRDFLGACEREGMAPPQEPGLLAQLVRVWGVSPFVARECARQPRILAPEGVARLERPLEPGELAAGLRGAVGEGGSEEEFMRRLRLFRQREMVRIAWRDIAGLAPLEETCGDLSDLADAAIDQALQWLAAEMEPGVGRPFDRDGREQSLAVIAMGKLGARELNFSSDVDLIFLHSG